MGRRAEHRKSKSNPTPESPKPTRSRRVDIAVLLGIAILTGIILSYPYWEVWMASAKQDPAQDPVELAVDPEMKAEGELPASLGLSWDAMDNPNEDGWGTEAFSSEAGKFLDNLGVVFLTRPTAKQLQPFVSEEFSCEPLNPPDLDVVYDEGAITVERLAATETSDVETAKKESLSSGAEGLAAAVQTLLSPLAEAKDVRWKFKVIRVGHQGDSMVTQQYVALSGRTPESIIEQNATWLIHWDTSQDKQSPRLESIKVLDFEQVTYKQSGAPMFADCTESVLGNNDCYQSQMLVGLNHWLNRSQDTRYFYLLGTPGMAIGDVNGDGLDDLYVTQEEGLPNRLFLQSSDGTARDVSEEWGVNWLHNSRGSLLVDLDNDGDQDLAVAMIGYLVVCSNEGNRFKVQKLLPTDEDNMSLCAGDYDGDGDLDIYVCALNQKIRLSGDGIRRGLPSVSETENSAELEGGRNTLFRNELAPGSNWEFADVTKEAGLDELNLRLSFAASFEDYDNDGDVDLYVANDYGQNNLYRNDDGKFTDVTSLTGATDTAFGMSTTWGDFDRDGWMDIYVSNMFSSAGERVTHQDNYLKESPEAKERLQRFAKGNTLLKNAGSAQGFTDVSLPSAVAVGRWAWGSNFVDINNDGWDDLVVANGFLTTDDTSDL